MEKRKTKHGALYSNNKEIKYERNAEPNQFEVSTTRSCRVPRVDPPNQ